MQPRVEIAEGTAFEVLVGAAAVADANWRDAFATGPAAYAQAVSTAGPEFVRRVAAFGRFGWLNLVTLVTSTARPWDLDHLIAAVRDADPEHLHLITVGGDRRQLLGAVGVQHIRAALAGQPAARSGLAAALASDDLVIEAAPWLLASRSIDVQRALVELLQTWQEKLLPPGQESRLARVLHGQAVVAGSRLVRGTSREFLDASIGGLHYDPAGLDRVVAISSPRVAPVVVVVDGLSHTVILHPPLGTGPGPVDGASRLLELGRAVGDRTRMLLLTSLRDGEKTAVALAGDLGAPRTTLLHHLAILRAAGLIHVTVTPGGATLYRLRPEGFDELSSAAARFIPTE